MFQFKEFLRQPSITVIGNLSLVERIDAGYYHASHLEQLNKIISKSHKKLSEIVGITKLSGFEFTAHFTKSEIASKEIPCVMSQNVRDNEIDLSETIFITKKTHQELTRSQLSAGDIVLSYTGHYRRAAVIKPADCPIHLGPNVCKLTPKNVDAYFVSSYLNSFHGQALLDREKTISAQPTVNMARIRELDIIDVSSLAQKYIGDKVRQAERLRAWAARAQEAAVREMPAYKPKISHYVKSSYRVSTDTLLSARLDSSFFHPDHRALDSKMKESGCQYFGKVTSAVKPGWNKKSSDSFLYYEIGGLNVANGTIVPVETLTSEAPSRATTAVKQGDVLVATVRPNRKNVGFVIEDAPDIPMVATSGFSVLRFQSLVEAAFYHAWLRTDDATSQLMRWNSGSAYPAIDEDVPLHIFVPAFDLSLRARLGQTLLDTHFAFLHSAKLTNAAKLLIEALIEGQLTEAELIAAEQALQTGNDQADRRILNRLKTDGVAGQGPALLGDMDELYRLLAQAEGD